MGRDRVTALSKGLAVAAVASLGLAGCGVVGTSGLEGSAVAGKAFHGTVYGGLQPVGFSQIQIYVPGTTGYGSASTSILNTPVMTDKYGNFNISGDYTCPSADVPAYMVVTGGNPGLPAGTNNAALTLMGSLGLCGNLGPTSFISISELTTVSAVFALQPFMSGPAAIGAPPSNRQGLLNAFQTIGSLVTTYGTVPGTPPAIATVPVAEIDTLGDALSTCVNTDGNLSAGTACGRLFAAATNAAGVVPTDTIAAALSIARNPGRNVAAIFNLPAASPPYLPTLTAAPADWTIAINYTAPAFSTPSDLAIDSQGTVWVLGAPGTANYGSSTLSAVTIAGGLRGSYPQVTTNLGNLAIDVNDNVWATNTNLSNVIEFTNGGVRTSFTPYTGGGMQGPGPIAFDPAGDAWVVNNQATVSELSASGTAITGSGGYATGGAYGPVALAIDAQGNVWTADSAGNTVSKLANNGTALSGSPFSGNGLSGPFAIAFDSIGEALVANRTGSSLTKITANAGASTAYSGYGLVGPVALSVDGQSTVWVVNGGANTISEIPVTPSSTVPQSGQMGYGSAFLTNPYKLAIDRSGSIWVANVGTPVPGSGVITQIVGAAAPVVTPVALAVKTNAIAQRP